MKWLSGATSYKLADTTSPELLIRFTFNFENYSLQNYLQISI